MASLEDRLNRLRADVASQGPTRSLNERVIALRQRVERQPTLQERSRQIYGFDDSLRDRGDIVPLAETEEGQGLFGSNITFATPQFARDMMESALLPGHVLQGGSYTPADVTRMALDTAVPATAGRPPGVGRPTRRTRQDVVENAPTTDQLRQKGGAGFEEVFGRGIRVDPDRNADLLAEIEIMTRRNRMNPGLHPNTTSAFKALESSLGEAPDMEDLQIARRLIQAAESSTQRELKDDRRIAGIMREMLDDFIDNLGPQDVVSGDTQGAAATLKQARLLWRNAAKSDIIEEIITKAETQPSGFENGIRLGFKNLLNDKKRIRGFSEAEKKLFKQIAQGKGTNVARTLGRLSFGTRGNNFLGGSIGTAGGSALAGPLGAVAAPLLGHAAAKTADRQALSSAQLARAIAAGSPSPYTARLVPSLEQALMRTAAPVAATRQPEVLPYNPNIL